MLNSLPRASPRTARKSGPSTRLSAESRNPSAFAQPPRNIAVQLRQSPWHRVVWRGIQQCVRNLLRESVSTIGVVGELHQPIAVVDADRHLTQRSDADKSSYLHIQIFAQPGCLKRNHAIHFLGDVGKPEGDVVRGVNLVYFAAHSMDNDVVLSMHLRDLA